MLVVDECDEHLAAQWTFTSTLALDGAGLCVHGGFLATFPAGYSDDELSGAALYTYRP